MALHLILRSMENFIKRRLDSMKYDPIMCMMVPDTVSIKDSAVNEYEIHYTVPGKSGKWLEVERAQPRLKQRLTS